MLLPEITGAGTGDASVIVDNMRAMIDAIGEGGLLTADRIANIQRTLLQDHAPHLVGWRHEPVWIGGGGSTPLTADYVAPDHSRIRAAIDDLVEFSARGDLPVLPQVAIAHAQFETIHPFADGNGRTGRVLAQLLLRSSGLTRAATVPISGGLLVERDRYFAALDAYRSGDAAPIIGQFVHAALHAVQQGRRLTDQLTELRDQWAHSITVRPDSAAWRVLDLLIARPVLDAKTIAEHLNIDPTGVRRPMKALVDAGIVTADQHYKSHKYLYRAPAVLQVLDDYSAGFGRRQR